MECFRCVSPASGFRSLMGCPGTSVQASQLTPVWAGGLHIYGGMGDAMLAKTTASNEIHNPVAISEKELLGATSFTLRTFELCTMCGARFGIGYHGLCDGDPQDTEETQELPRRLTEILAKDHRQNRAHKRFIDLDI
jgi:hypothetical protein